MRRRGLTLVELLIAITILAMLGVAVASLVRVGLRSLEYVQARSAILQEGVVLMDRITNNVRISTQVLYPNARASSRSTLVIAGFLNDDNDYYFGDPLFPRIDEDTASDMNADLAPGVSGLDDDGDGSVDEGGVTMAGDDDEDGAVDEDKVDGIDNDGDGNIDEDAGSDRNGDGAPGIARMDDDGDGLVDEGAALLAGDDDEDGLVDEDPVSPITYAYDSTAKTLREKLPGGSLVPISTHVNAFTVTRQTAYKFLVTLTMFGDTGEALTLSEVVHPRNTLQRLGKRAR